METAVLGAAEAGILQPAYDAALRTMAAGSGDWSLLIIRETAKILNEAKGDRPTAFAQGIDELLARNVISQEEMVILKEVVAAFWSAVQDDSKRLTAQEKILDSYQQLLLDFNTSAPALAIASVAARYVNTNGELPSTPSSVNQQVSVSGTPMGIGAGALAGAIIGGAFGSVFGPLGAAIGAGVGAAAGGAVGFSNAGKA